MTRRQILAEIDYVGGFLSIVGLILFLMGLQWGGYQVGTSQNRSLDLWLMLNEQYSWKSAHVLVPLLLGAMLIIAFFFWEGYGAKYPMFPHRLQQDPRVLALTLLITFISGANFFAILMFWPTESFNVYGHDPIGVGLRALPVGFTILGGACIVLVLLSVLRGHIRELMVASTVLMTIGTGCMSLANRDNVHAVYGILVVAGLGIGGILVPASIITTIICPGKHESVIPSPMRAYVALADDLIATVSAITLSIRVIGGGIGYSIYYNVFYHKFLSLLENRVPSKTNLPRSVCQTTHRLIQFQSLKVE